MRSVGRINLLPLLTTGMVATACRLLAGEGSGGREGGGYGQGTGGLMSAPGAVGGAALASRAIVKPVPAGSMASGG